MAFPVDVAFQYLEQARSHDRLGHAYLICGDKGSGKTELASRILGLVRGREPGPLVEEPGVTLTAPESVSRRIRVKQIRALEQSFYVTSSEGMKVGVILEADRLMTEAENAFLKTLEEPPNNTLLLLLTSRPELLLPTILSRCIRINLLKTDRTIHRLPAEAELISILQEHFQRTSGGGGNIGLALGLMRRFTALLKTLKDAIDKQFRTEYKAELAQYQDAEAIWKKEREEYYKALASSEYLQTRNRFLEIFLSWFADAVRQAHGFRELDLPECAEATAQLSQQESPRTLMRRLYEIEQLRADLETNVLEALALEVGFLRAFS